MIPKPPILSDEDIDRIDLACGDNEIFRQKKNPKHYYENNLLKAQRDADAEYYEKDREQVRVEVLKEVLQKLLPICKRSTTITEYALKLARLIDELTEALKSGTMPDVRRNTKADPEPGME